MPILKYSIVKSDKMLICVKFRAWWGKTFWYCIAAGIDVKLFPYNLQDRAEYGGEDIKCFCRGGWNIYNPSRNFNGVFIEKAKHCKYHII